MVLQRKGEVAGLRPLRLEHGPVVPLVIVGEWLGGGSRGQGLQGPEFAWPL